METLKFNIKIMSSPNFKRDIWHCSARASATLLNYVIIPFNNFLYFLTYIFTLHFVDNILPDVHQWKHDLTETARQATLGYIPIVMILMPGWTRTIFPAALALADVIVRNLIYFLITSDEMRCHNKYKKDDISVNIMGKI